MKHLIQILLYSSPLLSSSQIFIPGDFHNPINKSTDTTTLSMYSSIGYPVENGLRVNDVFFKVTHNSKYARGYNDGPVWKGKGFTPEIHAGISGKIGKLSYVFNPVIYLSQNSSFYIPNLPSAPNRYGYPYSSRIDWVSRYGENSFARFFPGQSEIRLDLGKFVTSMGTQNYSLGPSVFNPIILSRQGAGFPHIRLGLKPTYLSSGKNIAKVEANLLYGMLTESEYYDEDPDNNHRYFNGLFIALSPSFLPNLSLGFNKVLYKQTRYFQGQDVISPFFIIDNGVVDGDTLSPNDAFDQMASLFINWNFPSIGFRAYLEFAKNDFTSDGAGLRPTAVEPEHSRGYTIGFEKTITNKNDATYIISYEHTNLSIGHQPWRPTPPFYAHSINTQGYTQDGQLIGAGIGPGGNSDHFNIRYLKNELSCFVLLQRIERDRDYFVRQVRNSNLHDIEYTLTIGAQKQFDRYDLFIESAFSHNYSRYFQFNDQGNVSFAFGGRWKW